MAIPLERGYRASCPDRRKHVFTEVDTFLETTGRHMDMLHGTADADKRGA